MTGPASLDALRDDFNWRQVFGYAESEAGVSINAVAEIIAAEDGENEGDQWVGVFRLNDGRFLYVKAGCDYTGWG